MEVSKNWKDRPIHIQIQVYGGSAEIDNIMVGIMQYNIEVKTQHHLNGSVHVC